METSTDPTALTNQLLTNGLDADANALRQLALLARRAGVPPVVVSVLVDPTEPPVTRHRALGRIAVALHALTTHRPQAPASPHPIGADPTVIRRPAMAAGATPAEATAA